jgi:hypothetical protein
LTEPPSPPLLEPAENDLDDKNIKIKKIKKVFFIVK